MHDPHHWMYSRVTEGMEATEIKAREEQFIWWLKENDVYNHMSPVREMQAMFAVWMMLKEVD